MAHVGRGVPADAAAGRRTRRTGADAGDALIRRGISAAGAARAAVGDIARKVERFVDAAVAVLVDAIAALDSAGVDARMCVVAISSAAHARWKVIVVAVEDVELADARRAVADLVHRARIRIRAVHVRAADAARLATDARVADRADRASRGNGRMGANPGHARVFRAIDCVVALTRGRAAGVGHVDRVSHVGRRNDVARLNVGRITRWDDRIRRIAHAAVSRIRIPRRDLPAGDEQRESRKNRHKPETMGAFHLFSSVFTVNELI